MNKEEKTITLGDEIYEEFIEGKPTIDTHELLNLFAKRINNLQSKIDKANELLEELEYNQNINLEKGLENRVNVDYIIERLNDILEERK